VQDGYYFTGSESSLQLPSLCCDRCAIHLAGGNFTDYNL
jgi:hypothetical protein